MAFSDLRRAAKLGEVRLQHLQAAALERPQGRFTRHKVDRRPPLGAGFGEKEETPGKLEHCEYQFATGLLTQRVPPEPAGNHEMNYQKEIPLQGKDDTLAHASETEHPLPCRFTDRWVERAEYKGIAKDHPLQRLIEDPRGEMLEV